MPDKEESYLNSLSKETSPYLLQHQYNPVNWYPWCEEAFEKAKNEKKLVLVSIGYSSCHWCHVMEHESFEDKATADLMNGNFVCIKVDREERPDIDNLYMSAVQVMTGQGGWPLNCFVLPDKRPVYGGTYFYNTQWKEVLLQLSAFYKRDPEKAEEYASELEAGIKRQNLIQVKLNSSVPELKLIHEAYASVKMNFDLLEGGANRAPKFPLPGLYQFLMRYAFHTDDESCIKQIKLTLRKMAYGGIYDQAGGGFARYSTDSFWKVPHFEKMLYDNAQLVSLYCDAYKNWNDDEYKEVVYDTLDFIERELTSPEGGFYSAIDADSEKEEGKFYVWKNEELKELLGSHFEIFSHHFNVNEKGYWEHNTYILLRDCSEKETADKFELSEEALRAVLKSCKTILLAAREKRQRPSLDFKILCSWNAMMLKAYTDAYTCFEEKKFLGAAIKNAEFICANLKTGDGGYVHSFTSGKQGADGFLEDYAFLIDALIALYQCTFDRQWLDEAKRLADFTVKNFSDEENRFFYFTRNNSELLISRSIELQDNVIPSSNSVMARNLFLLGHYFDAEAFIHRSMQMMLQLTQDLKSSASWHYNWANLLCDHLFPFYEVVISGSHAHEKCSDFSSHYFPNVMYAGSTRSENEDLPLLKGRFKPEATMMYVCEGKVCLLPETDTEQAIRHIRKSK